MADPQDPKDPIDDAPNTIRIPKAQLEALRQFVEYAAAEPAADESDAEGEVEGDDAVRYDAIDSHQRWLELKDQAQLLCEQFGWSYGDWEEPF